MPPDPIRSSSPLSAGVCETTLELLPSPTAVTAVTQNWYCRPATRSSTVIDVTDASLLNLVCVRPSDGASLQSMRRAKL